jgi:hypothetical protein
MPIDLQKIKELAAQVGHKAQDTSRTLSDKGRSFMPYMLPAALAGGGAGALMGYTAGRNHIEGEAPRDRRHRILKNALLGLTLGGVAGAAVPAGLSSIAGNAKPMSGFHPVDAAANTAVRHWLPTATGATGTVLGYHHLSGNREQAASRIARILKPVENQRPGVEHPYEAQLMADASNPGKQRATIAQLGRHFGTTPEGVEVPGSRWQAKELLGEAGVHNLSGVENAADAEGLRAHLADQGLISKMVSRLIPKADSTGTGFADRYGTRIAENFSRYARPSVGKSLASEGLRLGTPALALGIGGSMLGANYLQNKLEGN